MAWWSLRCCQCQRYGRQSGAADHGPTRGLERVTVGGDKAYDTQRFRGGYAGLKSRRTCRRTTSVRGSAIDRRTTRHQGYQVSQRKRKRVEEVFGWVKTVGLLRKTRHRGIRVGVVGSSVRYRRLQSGPHPKSIPAKVGPGTSCVYELGQANQRGLIPTGVSPESGIGTIGSKNGMQTKFCDLGTFSAAC